MGDEIDNCDFSKDDVCNFREKLITETNYLSQLFDSSEFNSSPSFQNKAGLEIETCLVDNLFNPLCINAKFLKRMDDPLVSAELAQFNIELNSIPLRISGHFLNTIHVELNKMWNKCQEVAKEFDAKMLMIGILPTLSKNNLNLANLSKLERYRALNRETIRLRKGKPLTLDISGIERLKVTHRNVMLESAATSLQIHLEVDPKRAKQFYNISLMLSSVMVALTANSPFLFGKNLWSETRIPLFEQAVSLGGFDGALFGPIKRVSFGSRFVQRSLMELFSSNLDHYPILLPVQFNSSPEQLKYLRLHNGTIWRWNRPLIGFEENKIHLRIEHRVIAAGPSVIDTVANMAFFYGILFELVANVGDIETLIEFGQVRDNFYKAAQFGLDCSIIWLDGKTYNIKTLIKEVLLNQSRSGLARCEVASSDIREYLDIIEARIAVASNGSVWQRQYLEKHQCDMYKLTKAYYERQQSGDPVHLWTV